MAYGIIYIMTTSVEGLIKIGKTNDFKNRMNILEQNGYWNVAGLKKFYAVKVKDYDEKEKLIHTIFSKSQVANSELFALDKMIAKAMLESFEGEQIYPEINKTLINSKTNDNIIECKICGKLINKLGFGTHLKSHNTNKQEYNKKYLENNTQTVNQSQLNIKRKINTTFEMINIPIGSTLTFIKDSSKTVTTVNNINKVNLNGEIMAISKAASILRGKNSKGIYPSTCGQAWFTYNDRLITELRDELDKKESEK